jgi:outer membrane lipoprotein-sorting protein
MTPMKRILLGLAIAVLWATTGAAQTKGAAAQAGTRACSPAGGGSLEAALTAMDRAAGAFRSAQMDFVWTTYQALPIEDRDEQSGAMYIRKEGGGLQLAADIMNPPGQKKYVLYVDQTVQMYEPRLNRITRYKAGKHRDAFESFLVLGFGGRGHELDQRFQVHYCGMENAQGGNTYRLDLVPKAGEVRRMFDRIVLWIDPARGVSVQQKFFQPESQGYRLAVYSNIRLNQPVAGSVFSLKSRTNSKTETIEP